MLKKSLILFSLILIGLVIHKIFFYFFIPIQWEESFVYPIPLLYAFFGLFSITIISILYFIKKININNVGYVFLLLTSIKMAIAYVFLKPILEINLPKTKTEKISFFIIFIYFLILETISTIKILNPKNNSGSFRIKKIKT